MGSEWQNEVGSAVPGDKDGAKLGQRDTLVRASASLINSVSGTC